jgi:undecaprenyl-diphosphatase
MFTRQRPYSRLIGVNTFKLDLRDYSFPSGHTTAAFSVAVSFALVFPSIMIPLMLAALMVGLSRIYLGVHYPTDVVVGIIIGTVFAIMSNEMLSDKLMRLI